MVEDSARTFWGQVGEILRRRVSAPDWNSWFEDAEPTALGPESIQLTLPNEFAVRWVGERFADVIAQSVADVAGVQLRVDLVSRETGAAPAVEAAEDPAAPAAADAHAAASTQPAAEADVPPTQDGLIAPLDASRGNDVTDVAASLPQVVAAHAASHAVAPEPAAAAASGPGQVMTEEELRAELGIGGAAAPTAGEAAGLAADAAPGHAPHQGNTPTPAGAREEMDRAPAGTTRLNPRYRFETFVIGEGNQMAHAAAMNVAEAPAQSYNPLFVYGGTGLGKTHLLHAIGHFVQETRPHARVAYVTTEDFVTSFIQAIQATKVRSGTDRYTHRDRFKTWFRGVDVLLMDDVQFLANKGTALQEELFHIFNALHERGGQVVLTSDCKPEQIPQLEERLRSRFAWGLITDIATPDRETRIAILRKKSQVDGLQVPQVVFEEIAERITSSVRELEGALTRVVAAASLTRRTIDVRLAGEVLDSYAPRSAEPVSIERIQHVVCDHFGITRDELVGQRRTRGITHPRQIAMYLSRVLIGAPSTQVAQRFNRRDHSTVLHAERRIEESIRADQDTHDLVARLTETVRRGSRDVAPTR